MNKKDLKMLAAGAVPAAPVLSRAADALSRAAGASRAVPSAVPAETPARALWRATYAALVGGNVGGLLARIPNPERFESQLETLAKVADAAVNCALRRGSLDENQGVKASERN